VLDLLWAVLALAAGVAAGVGIGIRIYKNNVNARLQQSEAAARLQLEEARSQQKEILLQAKDEALRLRNEAEAELREQRQALLKQEERLTRKEENLDRKIEGLERRDRQVQNRERQIEALHQEAEKLRGQQAAELERISQLNQEDARALVLAQVERETRDEAARRIREIEHATKEEADKTARKILGMAIQRAASEYVAEITVSTVALPGEELKGRIIGREGVLLHGSRARCFNPVNAQTRLNLFHGFTAWRDRLLLAASVRPGGLWQLDPATDAFGRFQPRLPALTKLDSNPAFAFGGPFYVEAFGDVIWAVASKDIFRFDGERWERIQHPDLP